MFGKNELTKRDYSNPNILDVKDIFYTIQGEGPFSGRPAVFIRLAGCNLKCWFCDTYFEDGSVWSTDNILLLVKELSKSNTNLVVITGGEPFIQPIGPLCTKLIKLGYLVQVETSGNCCPPELPWEYDDFYVVCSPKTPTLHVAMKRAHCWKYVVRHGSVSLEDGLPMISYQDREKDVAVARPMNQSPVYVTPMDEYNTDRRKQNTELVKELALRHGYRVSLQTHKILGVD